MDSGTIAGFGAAIVVGLAGLAGLAGCDVGAAGDGGEPAAAARAMFVQRAWPALAACAGCHQSQPGIDFLAPGTPDAAYDTVFAYQPPVIDVEEPAASLVVTMGKHTGPALDPVQAAAVVDWLELEQDTRTGDRPPPAQVGPVDLQLGALIALDLAPAGAPGASLRFVADVVGSSGVYLTRFELAAGAAALRVTHPLVVSHPAAGDPVPDPVDQFAELDVALDPDEVLALGGGTAVLLGFAATDPVSIHFRALEEVMP